MTLVFAQRRRQQLVGFLIIDAPDRAVVIEFAEILGGEVCGHIRRICPVRKPRRKTVMLGQGKPVPNPIAVDLLLGRVFAKAGEQMFLMRDEAAGLQTGVERVRDARHAAKDERRPEALDAWTP